MSLGDGVWGRVQVHGGLLVGNEGKGEGSGEGGGADEVGTGKATGKSMKRSMRRFGGVMVVSVGMVQDHCGSATMLHEVGPL